MSDLLIGTLINDKFEIESKLGEGGMGAIYQAKDLNLFRTVAVKFLGQRYSADEVIKRRFLKEARAAGKLIHPSIMAVYEAGEFEDLLFIAMEFIDGHSVAEEIRNKGPVAEETAIKLAVGICEGLSEAHSQGIVHRDIKPSNIMLPKFWEKTSQVKIVDFGLAQFEELNETKLTRSGSVLGSPAYMSPEQCQGRDTDARSDIYSLGCTLFEMLTGVPPFDSDSPSALIIKHVKESPPTLREAAFLNGTVFSPGIEKIVKKMLAKQPDDRYRSVDLLAEALRNLDPNAPNLLEDTTKDAAQISGNRKLLVVVISACIILSGMFSTYLRWQDDSARRSSETSRTVSGATVNDHSSPLPKISHRGDEQIKNLKKLGSLPKVIDLSGKDFVDGNDFSDAGLKELSGTSVTALYLPETEITPDGLSYIESLPLTDLEISGSAITDLAMTHVARLTALKKLALSNTSITDGGINRLTHLTKLQYLDLDNTPATNAISKTVSNMQDLHGLSMRRTQITAQFVCDVIPKKELQELFLSETNVNDDSIACLSLAKKLMALDLRRTKISGTSLSALLDLPNLSYLDLSYDSLDDGALEDFLLKKRSMVWLYLSGCKLSSSTIHALASMRQLVNVELSNTDLSNQQLEKIASNPSLHAIGIKNTHTTASKQAELKLKYPYIEFKLESALPELTSFVTRPKLKVPSAFQ